MGRVSHPMCTEKAVEVVFADLDEQGRLNGDDVCCPGHLQDQGQFAKVLPLDEPVQDDRPGCPWRTGENQRPGFPTSIANLQRRAIRRA